jgi:hypothetical protein
LPGKSWVLSRALKSIESHEPALKKGIVQLKQMRGFEFLLVYTMQIFLSDVDRIKNMLQVSALI